MIEYELNYLKIINHLLSRLVAMKEIAKIISRKKDDYGLEMEMFLFFKTIL